jgi:aminopeptidase N
VPDHLTEHHRVISQQKREAVVRAVDAMIVQGVAFHWTTLARRAGVSVKFINDPKHGDLKEHVKEKLAAAYDQQAAQAVAASNATAAQLRVKVANHAAQLRRQDQVIKVLERKLGEHLGSEIAQDLPAITGAALASKPDAERIAELQRRVVELEDELLVREETIDGLRAALRQGIRKGEFG